MAKTRFSGPIQSGPVPDTTGTDTDVNMANVGNVVLCQSKTLPYLPTGDTAASTGIVLPVNSQILNVQGIVTVNFNAAALLSIGLNTGAANLSTDCFANDTTILTSGDNFSLLPGISVDKTASSLMGFDGTGAAEAHELVIPIIGTVSKFKNIGTTTAQLEVLYKFSQDLTAGEFVLSIIYVQGNNLS